MDSKGGFLLQAAGPRRRLSSSVDEDQAHPQMLSVRQKARLYETRSRTDFGGLGSVQQQRRIPNVAKSTRPAWPPRNPGGDTAARHPSGVEIQEESESSVKNAQVSFGGLEGNRKHRDIVKNYVIKQTTNVSKLAPQGLAIAPPPSVKGWNYENKKASAGLTYGSRETGQMSAVASIALTGANNAPSVRITRPDPHGATCDKPAVLSVKDIIKRMESESDNYHTSPVNSDLPKLTSVRIEVPPHLQNKWSTDTTLMDVTHSDVHIRNLKAPLTFREETLNREQIFTDISSDGIATPNMGNLQTAIYPKWSRGDSEEEEQDEESGVGEGMVEDMQLTWRNDMVLVNNLRQALSDMLNPPTVHCLYQQDNEEPLTLEGQEVQPAVPANPAGVVDVRHKSNVTSPECDVSQPRNYVKPNDAVYTNEPASGDQVFIPVEEVNVCALTARRSFQSCPVQDHVVGGGEELVVTSELGLCNATHTEVSSHTPEVGHDNSDVDALNQILDDLDIALLSELTCCGEEELLSQTEKLCVRLTHLSEERGRVLLAQAPQEVTGLNKETADYISSMRTVNEDAIKAVIVGHQRKHRQIFHKLLARLPTVQPERRITGNGRPLQGSAVLTSGANLQQEVGTVDVLSQMTDVSVSPPAGDCGNDDCGNDDVIWIPSGTLEVRVGAGVENSGSAQRSSMSSTSTTTFRMDHTQHPRLEGIGPAHVSSSTQSKASLPRSRDVESGAVSVSNIDIAISLQMASESEQMRGGTGQQVTISLPGSDNVLQGVIPAPVITNTDPTAPVRNTTPSKSTLTTQEDEETGLEAGTFIERTDAGVLPTFSRININDGNHFYCPDLADTSTPCSTFIVNTGANAEHTFSRAQREEEGSYSGGSSCSGGDDDESSEHLVSDGDEDDDVRRLQQRYGEILEWSDTERFSQSSDDDGSVSDSAENDDTERDLKRSLKMTLTLDIKEKLQTMTEKDFASMMSEYRHVVKQTTGVKQKAVRESLTQSGDMRTVRTHWETGQEGEEKGVDWQAHSLGTVLFNPKLEQAHSNVQTGNAGLGDTCCDVTMTLHTGNVHPTRDRVPNFDSDGQMQTCDASTGMGEMTLKSNIANLTDLKSGSAALTDVVSSSGRAAVMSQSSSQTRICGSGEENSNDDDDVTRSDGDLLIDHEKEVAVQFRTISQGLEVSDRELVVTLTGGELGAAQWEELLADHVEKTESVRMWRQAEASRNKQRLAAKLAQHKSSWTWSAQAEEDMVRLKDELLTRVKAGGKATFTQEEMLAILAEYRKEQRELVEHRLLEKAGTKQKLQERLANERQLKTQKRKMDAVSLEDTIREMDETFYGALCERQRTLPIPDDELGQLVSAHVDKVESFRRKLEEEVAQKRREAIQKRLAQVEDKPEDKARDADFATELVQKERETAELVKKSRDRERARFDRKLKAKLAEKKKQRDQRDHEE